MASAGRKGPSADADVTRRPGEALDPLSANPESLQLAVDVTGIGVWDVDAQTGERRWSPQFKTILGLPADASPDRGTFTGRIHPQDVQWVDDLYRRMYEPESGGSYEAEFRIIRASDQAERWVRTTGRITFGKDGRALRGIGTLQDVHDHRSLIEALRESEDRLLVALEAGRMGTWRYNLITGQQTWNARQYELLGLDPSQSPSREMFLSVVHPDDRGKVAFDIDGQAPPTALLDSEFRVRAADGRLRWIQAHSLTTFDRNGKPAEMIGVNFDITERKQAEARQNFLVGELNHRVKNTLATVQAIVAQTLRGAASLEAAREGVSARLAALAKTHDLLTAARWGGTRLSDMVAAELDPYGRQAFRLDGPPVVLAAKAAVTLGIVLHELATNAAKYGALSAPDGCVAVSWDRSATSEGAPLLHLEWRENGGPVVRPPQRQGFGSRLIQASVTGDLAGTISLDYAPEGLRCSLSFSLEPVEMPPGA